MIEFIRWLNQWDQVLFTWLISKYFTLRLRTVKSLFLGQWLKSEFGDLPGWALRHRVGRSGCHEKGRLSHQPVPWFFSCQVLRGPTKATRAQPRRVWSEVVSWWSMGDMYGSWEDDVGMGCQTTKGTPIPSPLYPLAYPQAGAVCTVSVFRRRAAGAGKREGAYCTV